MPDFPGRSGPAPVSRHAATVMSDPVPVQVDQDDHETLDESICEPTPLSVARSDSDETLATVIHGVEAAPTQIGETGVCLPMPIESIGGVRLQQLLGSGGMGEVFLGHHETLDIPVAVKLIKGEHGTSERFLQEVRTSAKIQHENVVRVFNAGVEDGRLYLVMELVGGGDVADLIKRHGALQWRRAADVIRQAAAGLGAAHDARIVHRDVKPANLMLTETGKVKLADLGLAKEQHTDSELTQAGAIMGTPAYMAPEQIRDSRVAGKTADVYALGIALFQMLTGTLPFRGETTTAVMLAHINDPVPDVRSLVPDDVPEALINLVLAMLAKMPEHRPADGNEVERHLGNILAGEHTKISLPMPVAAPAAERRDGPAKLGLVLALVGVVALVAIALSLGMRGGSAAAVPVLTDPDQVPPPPGGGAAGVVAAAPSWQTPPRAVFLLPGGDLSPEQQVAIEAALMAGPLRVVDRQQVGAFVREQDFARGGRMDMDTAVNIGRGIGGHVAVVAAPVGELVQLRTFAVETTELTGVELVAPAAVPDRALAMSAATATVLPMRGHLRQAADGAGFELSLGAIHGVRAGDRFAVFMGSADEPGSPVAVAVAAEPGRERTPVSELRGQVAMEALPALVEARRE
ncbi:MAG: serine/threonine-protein kinase [Planctomycetota bacterium]|jgi:hypothetical protein|nr:serine/threonine-protein kinase [Planctomycetota bacterium]